MNSIRNFLKRPHVVVLLSLLIFITSCQKSNSLAELEELNTLSTNRVADSRSSQLSGKEYFQGVFFGMGALGAALPEVVAQHTMQRILQEEEYEAMKGYMSTLSNYLEKKHSDFFPFFKKAMLSNDPYQIEEALAISQDKIFELNQQLFKVDMDAFIKESGIGAEGEFSVKNFPLDRSGKIDKKALAKKYPNLRELLTASNELDQHLELNLCVAVVLVLVVAIVLVVPAIDNNIDTNELHRELLVESIIKFNENLLHPTYSGQELFEGIFFGHGNISEVLPSVVSARELRTFATEEELLFQEQIMLQAVAYIQEKDKHFFAQLKEDFYSKDPYKIEKRIAEIRALIKEVVNDNYLNVDDFFKKHQRIITDVITPVDSKGLVDLEKLNQIRKEFRGERIDKQGLVAVVLVAVYAWFWMWGPCSADIAGLQAEILVSDVMKYL